MTPSGRDVVYGVFEPQACLKAKKIFDSLDWAQDQQSTQEMVQSFSWWWQGESRTGIADSAHCLGVELE